MALRIRALLAAAAIGAATLLTAAVVPADVDDFTFDEFHADMTLSRADDGHAELTVTETIVARFPDEDQNRGIVRAIPDDYDRVPLHTEVTSVTGAGGSAIPYEITRDGDVIVVSTGDDSYVRGPQTYVITYTQRDTIRAFADTGADEFYRDINGTEWEQPFGSVSATVTVDAALRDALTGDAACYLGAYGSSDTCEIPTRTDAQGATQFFAEAYNLEAGENVTVAFAFEPGTFVPGEVVLTNGEEFAIDAAPVFQAGSIGALVLAVLAAAGVWLGRRQGRDAAGRGIIVAQYDAPSGLTVMEAAHLVGRGATAVPAAIIDLAVAGHLRILVGDDETDLTLEYAAPSDVAARQEVLDALFGGAARTGRRVALKTPDAEVAKRLAAVSASARDALSRRGLTGTPRRGLSGVAIGLAVIAFVGALLSVIFTATASSAGSLVGLDIPFSPLAIIALVASITVAALSFVLFRWGRRVTDAGADARDHLEGLKVYLDLAETDRIRMLQSPEGAERRAGVDPSDPRQVMHLYEKLLPYAVIWGVEKDWADVLSTKVDELGVQPGWYAGDRGFSAVYLGVALSTLRTNTNPVTASWAAVGGGSSATGGSFGGGFSGGGMGGGGGGGR